MLGGGVGDKMLRGGGGGSGMFGGGAGGGSLIEPRLRLGVMVFWSLCCASVRCLRGSALDIVCRPLDEGVGRLDILRPGTKDGVDEMRRTGRDAKKGALSGRTCTEDGRRNVLDCIELKPCGLVVGVILSVAEGDLDEIVTN